MAQIFPTIENIERLKERPTEGEWFLLNYLLENLDDDFEIYFQSFLGISRPDIIIMKKGCGVAVIEVKDWNPGKYFIDENNCVPAYIITFLVLRIEIRPLLEKEKHH